MGHRLGFRIMLDVMHEWLKSHSWMLTNSFIQTFLSANDEAAGGESLTASEVEALREKTAGMKLEPEMIATENEEETAFVAFARVFSG